MLVIALLLAPAAPHVSARAYCIGGVGTHDVGIVSSYTAGASDEYVNATVSIDGVRIHLGRRVFVAHGATYSVSADFRRPAAPNGVRVHWSGFSSPRGAAWSIVVRTPSIAC